MGSVCSHSLSGMAYCENIESPRVQTFSGAGGCMMSGLRRHLLSLAPWTRMWKEETGVRGRAPIVFAVIDRFDRLFITAVDESIVSHRLLFDSLFDSL